MTLIWKNNMPITWTLYKMRGLLQNISMLFFSFFFASYYPPEKQSILEPFMNKMASTNFLNQNLANSSAKIPNGQHSTWNICYYNNWPKLNCGLWAELHLISDAQNHHILIKLQRIWYSQVNLRPDKGYFWEEATNSVWRE